MLLTRFRSLMLVLGLLGGSSAALAQPASSSLFPFPNSVLGENGYQMFAPADLSTYGTTPRQAEGVFFRYDRLRWLVSGPKEQAIGNRDAEKNQFAFTYNGRIFDGPDVIGPTDPNTGLPISNQSSFTSGNIGSLDTGFIGTEWAGGNRYELGYMKKNRGWMVGVSNINQASSSITQINGNIPFADPQGILKRFVDLNNDGQDDDVDGDGIFGNSKPFNYNGFVLIDGRLFPIDRFDRFGEIILDDIFDFDVTDRILDSYAGPDRGDLVAFPLVFNVLRAINNTRVTNVEIMHLMRWDRLHDGSNAEWMLGLRYTNVNDHFILRGTNSGGSVTSLEMDSIVNNSIVGPQIGFRWNTERGPWQINTEARVTAGANFQNVSLRGAFAASNELPLDSSDPLTGVNFLSFDESESSIQFSPLGEIRLDIGYRVTKAINLRFGYTGTAIGGITRASSRINYELPGTDPAVGYTTRGIQINDEHRLESFWMSGINFGVEINR